MSTPVFTVVSDITANESINLDGETVYNFARQGYKNDGSAR